MNTSVNELIHYLSGFATTNRFELFNKIVQQRTRYLTVVLEDIYQSHNTSAVLRSADCFGIQDVHIIENKNKYQVNQEVAMGSSKWLTLHNYYQTADNTLDAITKLKNDGYRIVATTPHSNDVDLDAFDLSKGKTALLFGTELQGLTKTALENADEFLKIPMVGFTESLNISVSAAVTLHHLTLKLRKTDINWQLSQAEINDLLLEWLKLSIKDGDAIAENFLKKNS